MIEPAMVGVADIRLIRDSAGAITAAGDLKRIRALRFQQPGFDPTIWQQMAGLGWLGLLLGEARGGSGLGMAEFCGLAEELGAALVPEPLIPCAVAIQLLPDTMLEPVLAGQTIVMPAWRERGQDLLAAGRTRLLDGRLSGTKRAVPLAAAADLFLVTTGDGLALVSRTSPGVTIRSATTQDGGNTGEVTFDNAEATAIAGAFDAAFDAAALATSAYLFGAMQRAFEMTLDYMKLRKQFGRFIGSFQALQHRAVDLKIQIELCRAALADCLASFDAGTPAMRQMAASRAKARCADAAILVAREAIQFHGAIGMTDECDVGLYARKILSQLDQFGSAAAHRSRFLSLHDAAAPA